MSLVTAQGLDARRTASRRIDEVKNELQAFLASGPAGVKSILDQFKDEQESIVREAMWRLIDDRQAEIGPSRQLQLTAQG